jgi:hypothetical protein
VSATSRAGGGGGAPPGARPGRGGEPRGAWGRARREAGTRARRRRRRRARRVAPCRRGARGGAARGAPAARSRPRPGLHARAPRFTPRRAPRPSEPRAPPRPAPPRRSGRKCLNKWACANGGLTTVSCCSNSYGCIQSIDLGFAEGKTVTVACDTCNNGTAGATRLALDGERLTGFTVSMNKWRGGGYWTLRQCVSGIQFTTSGGRTLACGAGASGGNSTGKKPRPGRGLLVEEPAATVTLSAEEATGPALRDILEAQLFGGADADLDADEAGSGAIARAGRGLLTNAPPGQPLTNNPVVPPCVKTQGKKQNKAANCFLCGLSIKRCRKDPSGTKSINRMLPVWSCDLNNCVTTTPAQWQCASPIECQKGGQQVTLAGTCTTNLQGFTVAYTLNGSPVDTVTCPKFGEPSLEIIPVLQQSSTVAPECAQTGPPVQVNPPKSPSCINCPTQCPDAPAVTCPNVPVCQKKDDVLDLAGACSTNDAGFSVKYLSIPGGAELTSVTCPGKGGRVDVNVTLVFNDIPACTYQSTVISVTGERPRGGGAWRGPGRLGPGAGAGTAPHTPAGRPRAAAPLLFNSPPPLTHHPPPPPPAAPRPTKP